MEDIWGILLIVGPILLLAAMVYAWFKNRSITPREEDLSDAGTRALRHDIENDPNRPVDL